MKKPPVADPQAHKRRVARRIRTAEWILKAVATVVLVLGHGIARFESAVGDEVKLFVAAALCLPALPSPLPAQQVVECGTDSSQRVLCAAGGKVESAKLVRDLSSNRCGPAGTWGWTGNAVWTDNGCRGQFAVTLAGAASGADSARGRTHGAGRGLGSRQPTSCSNFCGAD